MTFNVPFRAVIFDMDGVLFDSEWYYYHELAAFSDTFDLGVTEDERRQMVGNSSQNFFSTIQRWWQRAGHGQIDAERVRKVYYDWAATRSMDYRELLNPGVPQTLDILADHGVRCALASSSSLGSINQALDECGLSRSFETVVSGEQFRESKPNPEIYLHTLEMLGLDAHECCCVEDSLYGIEAGCRAGLTVVAKREERFGFSQAEADVIVDQIPDVLSVGEHLVLNG